MDVDRQPNAPIGRSIPMWIYGLAASGLAAGMLVLWLLTSHLQCVEREALRLDRQRTHLRRIVAELQKPLETLHNATSGFAAELLDIPPLDAQPLKLALDTTAESELLPEMLLRLRRLRGDLSAAAEQLELCRTTQRELLQFEDRRQAALAATQGALDHAHRVARELHVQLEIACIGQASDARGLVGLSSIRDALREIDHLVLQATGERDESQVVGLEGDIVARMDLLQRAVDDLRPGRTHDYAPLQQAVATVHDHLAGATETKSPRVLPTHLAWVRNATRIAEQHAALLRQSEHLQNGQMELHRLLSDAALAGNRTHAASARALWWTCLWVGAASGALFLVLSRALSRRAQAQIRALHEAQREAGEAMRAQSLFLANMSHEIRTPMNGVLGMAEMLEAGDLDDRQRQVARTIRSSSEALLTVINDILDLSKIQAGKLELSTTDFDLRNSVEDTMDLLGHLASQKGIELLCFVDHAVPRFVHGDPDRLRQILLNLAGNAVKFTHHGEVTVLVELVGDAKHAVSLQVTVSDTGVGIADEAQAKLFKPFTQADPTTTRRFGGTGLGLTIAKRLIQLMGGSVSVRSKLGVGSTFTFTVVLAPAHNPAPREEPADFSGRSVLIVDDNEANRELLATRLASWRMGFDVVENGAQALEHLHAARARGHSFDVVLLDQQLPDVSGIDLCRQIMATPELAQTRRVLLSSAAAKPADQPLDDQLFDAWLAKPIREGRLRECLQTMLQLVPPHRAGREGQEKITPLHLHVLVAEDNAINQRVMREILQRLGCQAEFAHNGQEAVDRLCAQDFDLVLMDCQMPEVDGFTATRMIRTLDSHKRDTPIIALTANVLPADRRACMASGMNDFLSKPIRREQLRAALVKWSAQPVA